MYDPSNHIQGDCVFGSLWNVDARKLAGIFLPRMMAGEVIVIVIVIVAVSRGATEHSFRGQGFIVSV